MFARLIALFCSLAALSSGGTVVVFLESPGASLAVLEAMQREVGSQMSTVGIKTAWKTSGTVDNGTVVVAKLRGTCDASAITHTPALVVGQPLGATKVIDEQISPFISLDCRLLNQFLGSTSKTASEQAYGRALGRLFAHELYHYLAQTKVHTPSGITRASVTPSDLLAEHLHFDEQASDRLRTTPSLDRGF